MSDYSNVREKYSVIPAKAGIHIPAHAGIHRPTTLTPEKNTPSFPPFSIHLLKFPQIQEKSTSFPRSRESIVLLLQRPRKILRHSREGGNLHNAGHPDISIPAIPTKAGMLFQTVHADKSTLTFITWKRALTGMSLCMPFQIVQSDKFMITYITFKRAFGAMSFCMTRKITLHLEAGITHLIFTGGATLLIALGFFDFDSLVGLDILSPVSYLPCSASRRSDDQTIRRSDDQTIRRSDDQTIRRSDEQVAVSADCPPTLLLAFLFAFLFSALARSASDPLVDSTRKSAIALPWVFLESTAVSPRQGCTRISGSINKFQLLIMRSDDVLHALAEGTFDTADNISIKST